MGGISHHVEISLMPMYGPRRLQPSASKGRGTGRRRRPSALATRMPCSMGWALVMVAGICPLLGNTQVVKD